ncbi:MAG: FAD-binding oxidoreductase [Curvibacter sp.]|nr:MAG: FAD-binding oxidoreductase [Curvibacter sp.]
MQTLDCDVLVVGGGIVGSSAALALARGGSRVVLIERDLCGSRSSGVNFGGVRRQGRPLNQLPLAQRAHGIWGRLTELIGIDGEYQRSGHLKLARSEADLASLERYREQSAAFDLGLQVLGRTEVRRRWPWLGEVAVGGSLCPEDGQANPRLVSPAFARAAERAGARVLERTPLIAVAHDGQRFVAEAGPEGLPAWRLRAPQLINCAGAWAGRLAAQFGEAVPLVSGHPAMAVTEPLPFFAPVSLGVEGGGIYGRQVRRGNFVLGGGSGLALDEQRARSSSAALLKLTQQAVELLPALRGAHIIRTWSGTEGYLPDRQPVLGPSHQCPGLWHGFGFAGAGFQIGPAAGEVLAELALQGHTSTPLEGFDIARFPDTASAAMAGH